jgi:hypothetical protein
MPVTSISDLQNIGTAIAKSGMFGVTTEAAGMIVAATCHQQGISLLEFARTYHIIKEKPSMRADAMLAEFRKRGGKYKIVENSVTRAVADFEFEGNKFQGVYTMDDAKRSGDCFEKDGKTLKHNWQHRAENMLWARMISRTVRILCPEIVAGIYTPEEVQDFDSVKVVQPISTGEAQARAIAATSAPVDAEPPMMLDVVVESAEVVNGEFDVCPIDHPDCKGQRWDSMPSDWLKMALEMEDLAEGHKATIRKVLGGDGK